MNQLETLWWNNAIINTESSLVVLNKRIEWQRKNADKFKTDHEKLSILKNRERQAFKKWTESQSPVG